MHLIRWSVVILIVSVAPVAAENWPRFRGPNGTGLATGQNLPIEFDAVRGVIWKTKIPGNGNSGPVLWDNRLYLQSASKDGKQRMLYCLDARSGKILWERTFPGIDVKVRPDSSLASATAAVDADGVFIPIWNGTTVVMMAFSLDGEPLWSRDLGRWISQHGTGASPIIVGDKVIFALDGDVKDMKGQPIADAVQPVLLAFNKRTGDIVWEAPREGYRACYSAPFLQERPGGAELIVTSTMAITSYDPHTGKQLWNWDWEWEKNNFPMPLRTVASSIMAGDCLIATSGDGGGDRRMVALKLDKNGASPQYAWGNGNKNFPYVPCPLAYGDYIYFVTEVGTAACYEAKSGKEIWRERLPGAKFYSSPVLVDGRIYAPSESGDVFVFAAEPTYKLLAQNHLGERFIASPAVANGRLYLRGREHLFCIGKDRPQQ
ncbi:MAG: PQQ-binding-like beta-propeller repeat protein [Gemmataceae bacterium]|nr:PQQ-binding-like beta-propeller repeat protein [Gemmataceae bacterium]